MGVVGRWLRRLGWLVGRLVRLVGLIWLVGRIWLVGLVGRIWLVGLIWLVDCVGLVLLVVSYVDVEVAEETDLVAEK